MGKNGYKDLMVWQKARDLAVLVYSITNQSKFKKDYGLCDQIRRAAVSVASNIAEGDERDTDKESVRFFFIAKGWRPRNKSRGDTESIGIIFSHLAKNIPESTPWIQETLFDNPNNGADAG